jgi:hypothetical protein
MKNIIENVRQDNRLRLLVKMFIFTAALGWLLTTAPLDGHAAASKTNKAPGNIAAAQAGRSGMQNAEFDTSAVPDGHKPEWAGIQNKLAKEYTACTDDCGDHLECQEKCWKVYEFRLGREHQRIMHKAQ